ncbi:transposase [Staphylococcus phage PG-2021_87]
MITKKVRLRPNQQQEVQLYKSSGTARFIYNWVLGKQQENYKKGNKFIPDSVLRKEITQLKKTEEFNWLNEVSNNVPKQAVKDACNSYKRFFKGQAKFPKFKSKKKTKPSFYNDTQKLKVKEKLVLLEKIGWVRTSEQLPIDTKYYNPRITFDGKYWYLSISIEEKHKYEELTNESLGIDLGIKELAICSDGTIYGNINKKIKVKKLEKRLRRLQRKVSRKYQNNKEGGTFVKTCNIIKLEKQIKLLQRRLSNIRKNYLHQTTTSIVKTKPRRIVIEDLNVSGMMKNRHLAKAIQNQSFYEFRRQLEYKCKRKGIELIIADRFFPSSKTCSNCGTINKNLKLSDRIFNCECGFSADRDFNASVNLANYNI